MAGLMNPDPGTEEVVNETSSRRGNAVAALLLFCIVAIAYLPSLRIAFVDDDYSFLRNLYLIFNGKTELIGKCFTGVFMDNPRYGVHYRPFLFFPLALEWLLCRANIPLLHLSNIVWHFLNSFLVFLAGLSIFRLFKIQSLYAVSFWGAVLFALHPFHAEGVNFWSTNPDLFFSTWYLVCLIFFAKYLNSRKNKHRVLSLSALLFALGTKETAATLPLILFLLALFSKEKLQKATMLQAGKDSFPFWLLLFLYWTLRALCLHTFMGGYFGPLTSDWLGSFAMRYLESNVFQVLFYPVCQLSKNAAVLNNLLAASYLAIGVLLVRGFRSASDKNSAVKATVFTVLYFIIAILPVCYVWCPSEDLHGTRLLYLPILGLCWFLSLTIFGLAAPGKNMVKHLTAVVLSCILAASLFESHGRWQKASSYACSLIKNLHERLAQSGKRKVILLTVPNRIAGVTVFCTFASMRDAFKAPFTEKIPWQKLDALEPHNYGDATLINLARLKRIAAKSDRFLVYDCKLNETKQSVGLLPFGLERYSHDQMVSRLDYKASSLFKSPNNTVTLSLTHPIDTASYQFLKLKFADKAIPEKLQRLALYWKETGEKSFSSEHERIINQAILNKNGELTVHTGENLAWLRSEKIDSIAITGDSVDKLQSISLLPATGLQPDFKPGQDAEELSAGIILARQGEFSFDYDASSIPEAAGIRVELMPPVTWLSFYTHTNADDKFSTHTQMIEYIDSVKGSFKLPDRLNSPIWHQIRIFAVDKNRQALGFSSDALYIQSVRHPAIEGALD